MKLFVLFFRIQRVTEEFQKYVKLKEVATSLNFKDDIEIADLVFEYWKLKRKVHPSSEQRDNLA